MNSTHASLLPLRADQMCSSCIPVLITCIVTCIGSLTRNIYGLKFHSPPPFFSYLTSHHTISTASNSLFGIWLFFPLCLYFSSLECGIWTWVVLSLNSSSDPF